MKILGIDPGLRSTGFGLINIDALKPHYIASGIVTTDAEDSLAKRLKSIAEGITQVIHQYKPDIACVEKVFVNVNAQSTLALGQARGAAITACVLSLVDVTEYTALQIKKSVAGFGRADKQQIARMVKYLLNLNQTPRADASDALAIALTCFYQAPHRLHGKL